MTPLVWILALVVATGAVAGVVVVVSRMERREGDRAEALVARLQSELADQRLDLEARNAVALRSAVDTVVDLAGDRLSTENDRSRQMLEERERTLQQRAAGMTAEFEKMRALVSELERERSRGMGDLERRLTEASTATGDLARTTGALKEALASSRTRGQWGERMAEDVLRSAGFVRDVNYRVQQSTAAGRPDITFLLPAGRHLHMDVKFPLDNYLRSLEADGDQARDAAVAAFVRDARNRVRELAQRDYADTLSGSLDQVLLFLPNEHVYAFLHDTEPTLLDEALASRVVLCSPITLFAVLAVIRQAVDDHMTEQRSTDILQALHGFAEQWDKFTDHLDKVGSRLASAQRAFDDVNGPRRRQLERQLVRVDDLHRDEQAAAVLALAPRPREDEDTDQAAS